MIDPVQRSGDGEGAPPAGDPPIPGHSLALTTEILNDATAVLAFATRVTNAVFDERLARNIYETQLVNLRERQDLAVASAYGRATFNVARRLAQNAKTVEEVAAAQLLLRNMNRDFAANEALQKAAAAAAAKKRKAMISYVVAGAAVLALVVTVVVMSGKPAPARDAAPRRNPSRRRRSTGDRETRASGSTRGRPSL